MNWIYVSVTGGPLAGLQRTIVNEPGILPKADGDQGMVSGYEVLLLGQIYLPGYKP